MDMGHIRIFHDARNDQVMMSIEVSFIYTFFFLLINFIVKPFTRYSKFSFL